MGEGHGPWRGGGGPSRSGLSVKVKLSYHGRPQLRRSNESSSSHHTRVHVLLRHILLLAAWGHHGHPHHGVRRYARNLRQRHACYGRHVIVILLDVGLNLEERRVSKRCSRILVDSRDLVNEVLPHVLVAILLEHLSRDLSLYMRGEF